MYIIESGEVRNAAVTVTSQTITGHDRRVPLARVLSYMREPIINPKINRTILDMRTVRRDRIIAKQLGLIGRHIGPRR